MLITAARNMDIEYQNNIKEDVYFTRAVTKLFEFGYTFHFLGDSNFIKFRKENDENIVDIYYRMEIESFDEYAERSEIENKFKAAKFGSENKIKLSDSGVSNGNLLIFN